MSFEQVKARHRLAWGLDVASYQKHTTLELVPVAEQLVEIADPAWDSALIDIGCGPGTATFPAAKRVGPGGRVLGVDLAAPMLAAAERAAQALQLTNVTFQVGDAEVLEDVPDASFDAAISNFGVIFAPRPAEVVASAARVLKPGGTFTISVWTNAGVVEETYGILRSITGPLPEGIPGPETWGDPGVAEERFSAAFKDVRVTPIEVPCNYPSVDDAWIRMRDGRPPFALAYGRLPLEQKQEVEQVSRDFFRRHADENGRVSYVRGASIVKGWKKG
jgi:SAM-dependent methyltransferase